MANFALDILYPQAVGAQPTGLDANNRCYFAYPGIEYNIQVAAVGGDFPYTYELGNAPTGMTVDAAGIISWPNPTTGTHSNIVITVRDAANPANQDSETWSIVVGTTGWRWLDATNGNDANTGILVADGGTGAWASLLGVYTNLGSNQRVIIRAGTYTTAGIETTNPTGLPNGAQNSELRIEWNNGTRGVIWIAYPGETVTLNLGYDQFPRDATTGYHPDHMKPRILFTGNVMYFDGLTVSNSMVMSFKLAPTASGYGSVVRRCTFQQIGPGLSGSNSSFIMYAGSDLNPTYGDVNVDNTYSGIIYGTGSCALKLYNQEKPLFWRCTADDGTEGSEGIFAVKAGIRQYTIRQCVFHDVQTGVGGNMNTSLITNTYGEICYSHFYNCSFVGIHVGDNRINTILDTYIYRCTIRAPIIFEALNGDGPIVVQDCVIVNANGGSAPWPFVTDTGIVDGSGVTINISSNPELSPTGIENLAGASSDGIVDVNGLLQGSFRTSFLGFKGYEILAAASSSGRTRHRGFRLRAA